MASSTPLITIGITCYNAELTIARAIESALAQNWPNLEIIVADDCSGDGSREIVVGYSKVRLVKNERNLGPGGTRQRILAEAKGEFLAFFDDDDVSMPERVRTQYERIISSEHSLKTDLIACYASGSRIYSNQYEKAIDAIGRRQVAPHGDAVAEWILFFGRPPKDWCFGATPSCALMARVSTFKRVGGFDVNFRRVEDLDFAVRLALAGGHFVGCSEKLFVQHATVAADKSHARNLEGETKLVEKYRDFLNKKKRFYYARKWNLLRFYHFQKDRKNFAWTLALLLLTNPLITLRHLFATGPKRLIHEAKMKLKMRPAS